MEVDEYGEPLTGSSGWRLPKGLTDPQCQARYVPGAVKKYRAYLDKHPDDGGAWEGLAYLYGRMTDPSTYAPGIDASDLGDPPGTNYRLLSYQTELKALALRPTSMSLRSSVNTTLSLATYVDDSESSSAEAAIVELYGGVDGVRRKQLQLIEETLELIARYPGRWPDAALWWQPERAQLLSDLKEWEAAQVAWTEVLASLLSSPPKTKHGYYTDVTPETAHLKLFECAMHFGQYDKAREHLDAAERSDKRVNLRHERFEFLQATAPAEARNHARQQAENELRGYAEKKDVTYLYQAATWFLRAGDVAQAREYWQRLASDKGCRLRKEAQQELNKLAAQN